MATIIVVVPTSAAAKKIKADANVDHIPFLGESLRYTMTEDEFAAWLDMWRADKSMGSMFYVERHGR